MILLAPCTLLWLARGQGLPPAVATEIDTADAVYVSAVSALEIGIKVAKGRLTLGPEPRRWWASVLDQHGLGEVPVEGDIAPRCSPPTL